MAVTLLKHYERFAGLSTDVKPANAPMGSTFFEWDTSKLYTLSPAGWVEKKGTIHGDVQLSGSIVSEGEVNFAGSKFTPVPVGENEDYIELVKSVTYPNPVRMVATDSDHVYVAHDGMTVQKRLKSTLELVAESPSYGGLIYALQVDDNYVYVAGETTKRVRRYNKSDLTYVDQSNDYGSIIMAISQDNTHLFVGGGGPVNKVWKISKTDLSKEVEEYDYAWMIRAIRVDGEHVFVAGDKGKVVKILKSNMTFLAETDDYGGEIYTIAVDASHVYAGGNTIQRIRKYLKSDMSYIAQSDALGCKIRGLAINDNYVFSGGAGSGATIPPRLRKFNKSDLILKSESIPFALLANAVDDNIIYSASSAGAVNKFVHILHENLFWARNV